jgi:hypothetical protein
MIKAGIAEFPEWLPDSVDDYGTKTAEEPKASPPKSASTPAAVEVLARGQSTPTGRGGRRNLQRQVNLDCRVSSFTKWSKWEASRPLTGGVLLRRGRERRVLMEARSGGKRCPPLVHTETLRVKYPRYESRIARLNAFKIVLG